jgi:hypothetical protein
VVADPKTRARTKAFGTFWDVGGRGGVVCGRVASTQPREGAEPTEGRPKEHRDAGLSAEKVAELLGVCKDSVEVLAGQGRLKAEGDPDARRCALDSVLSMQAEGLIRGCSRRPGTKTESARQDRDAPALQYQRRREAVQRAEHWEIVVERIEAVEAERIEKANREFLEELWESNAAEMRAMEEDRLRWMPLGKGWRGTG